MLYEVHSASIFTTNDVGYLSDSSSRPSHRHLAKNVDPSEAISPRNYVPSPSRWKAKVFSSVMTVTRRRDPLENVQGNDPDIDFDHHDVIVSP